MMLYILLEASILLMCVAVSAREGFFWQINDFHYDPFYEATQESCNDLIPAENLGAYGHYECDAPWRLVENSIYSMKNLSNGRTPDFILWLGDNVLHPKNKHNLNFEIHMEIQRNVTKLMKEVFGGVKFYVTLGNHDYEPDNQLPAHENPYYHNVADMWQDWLMNPDANATFRQGAFYTAIMDPTLKMRAVIVNTNLYNKANDQTKHLPDPADQFKWFDDVMTTSRTNSEKVYMIIHIPPGIMEVADKVSFFTPEFNQRFNNLVRKHSDIIVAIFTAHEHTDSFKLYYKNGKPVVSMFIAPSVTPWKARLGGNARGQAHNPGLRKFTYSTTTLRLTDFEQYFLQLPDANGGNPLWKKEYTASQIYGLADASADSLHGLLQDFKSKSSKHFDAYEIYNAVNLKPEYRKSCDEKCKKVHTCAIEHVDFPAYESCMGRLVGATARPHASKYFMIFSLLIVCVFVLFEPVMI